MEWKKIEKWSLFVSLFLMISILGIRKECSRVEQLQKNLAKGVVRFHVLANSDSEWDQQRKLMVRDQVVTYLNGKLKGVTEKKQAEKVIKEQLDEIKKISEHTLAKNGGEENVEVYLTTAQFPVKTYGNLVLPAGTYDTAQIKIGKGNGHNWWCVMYPSMCTVKESMSIEETGQTEDDQKTLEEILTTQETKEVLCQPEEKTTVKYRFKFVEWIERHIP